MSTESDSSGSASKMAGTDLDSEHADVPVVIPPTKKVKGPTGRGGAQAPARPSSARGGGRTAGAKAATPVAEMAEPGEVAAPKAAAGPSMKLPPVTAPGTTPAASGGAGTPATGATGTISTPETTAVPTAGARGDEPIPVFSPPVIATAGAASETSGKSRPAKGSAAASAGTTPGPVATSPAAVTTAAPAGVRRTKVSISHISPWSVMKLSFLLSIAIGLGIVVVFYVFWTALDKAEVFIKLNDLIVEIAGNDFFPLLDYVRFDRVMSMAVLLAVADIVILTLLSTLGAVIYNLITNLVGGLHVTLTDE